ncbi:hypothetical protein PIIN_05534 [Serendipita indica DSM 11827]|uniref:Methylosome subunit pICln n=1 Tax=Serendipita indica (strain DSM 11827) TaxID=1109443 RepID=G4TJU9_SERID|nr:hypothetical protein PIIN_05534 [Serendipita indica DSM 11827]
MTEQDCANGIVYVLSSHLIFWSATGKGLQVTYPTISLHAISRAELGPSIYCQLDETLDGEDEPTPDEEDAMEMRELRLNVQSEASLEPLFEALSQCAALHPDEDNGEEDEFDDAFLDADEMGDGDFVTEEQGELSEAGRATLAHLESILADPHRHLPADSDEEADERGSNQNARIANGP